jgi:hypothetical protein
MFVPPIDTCLRLLGQQKELAERTAQQDRAVEEHKNEVRRQNDWKKQEGEGRQRGESPYSNKEEE